ncbi:MAG: CidA/LrgA family protein [Aeromicrobium sp.]|nr:CidA/LrgA family protein [Burkholderiales bacterium]
MIQGLAILLVFQSLGELASRLLQGAMPGPVLGLILLLAFLVVKKDIAPSIASAADGLLAHLSIFFIPAAVGVMLYASTLAQTGAAWVLAILLSTVAAISTTALVLRAMSKSPGPSTGQPSRSPSNGSDLT